MITACIIALDKFTPRENRDLFPTTLIASEASACFRNVLENCRFSIRDDFLAMGLAFSILPKACGFPHKMKTPKSLLCGGLRGKL
jgi:hypothetical protein